MVSSSDREKILSLISKDELATLTRDLVDIPSPTGHERELGEFILGWVKRAGMKPVRQIITEDRINAVGIVEGTSAGTSLQINGHLDTSFTGTEEDAILCRELEPVEELRGRISDGKVFGLAASNMKGGLASFLIAGKALAQSGVKLKGDFVLACVAGEISRTPIGTFQSERYRGEGTGTRHLLTHGMQTDYAICADGSALSVIWAQTGVAQFRIQTFGKAGSAWGKTRQQQPAKELNAVLKMMDVVAAVEAWAEEFEARTIYQSANGPIISKINVGAIQGGGPYRPNYYPGVCDLFVDARFPPKVTPVEVHRQLRKVLAKLPHETNLEMYGSQMGYDAVGAEPVIDALEGNYQKLYGEKTPKISTGRSSIWTDTNIYNEMGIPCAKFGPRGSKYKGRCEQIEVDEIYRAAQVFAMTAADICDREA